MRILITGAGGQLGQELCTALANDDLCPLSHAQLDICHADEALSWVAAFHPEVVIHAAAYTDTAGCEADPDRAYLVNAVGTRNVCQAAQAVGAALLYISTNEVFDGAQSSPYLESDAPNPLNVYGKSKLAGEQYVQTLSDRYWIVRTAWLYAAGHRNFITRILDAAAERGSLSLVTDEVATPTWARDLAMALKELIRHPLYGIYHFTNAGSCSRLEWAKRVLKLLGLGHIAITPVTQKEYGLPCAKPPFSALHNLTGAESLGIVLRPWEEALKDFLDGGLG